MLFTETELPGAFMIDLELRSDARGFFARAFCIDEFGRQGLSTTIVQANISYNVAKGTLRGMHYQLEPAGETKLVRCISGAIYDVIVDLRPESPTYLQHVGVTLSAENRRALYVPKMFAHGYLTLTEGAEVLYQVDAFYAQPYERGLRYDDPALGIVWPEAVTTISEKDQAWALL
ncbi:MAG: dTDP-4-dehydrorhamnose 3,5-epimerase [Chloroflexota bacterium]